MFQSLSTTFLEENSFVIVPRVHKAHENWTSVYWALVGTVGEYWTTVNLLLRLPLSYIWQSELLIRRLSIENSKFKDIVSFCIALFHSYFFFLNMSFFNFKGKLNKLKWLKDTFLGLHWVFVAVRGLSLVAASGGCSSLRCTGFSLRWPLVAKHGL